MTYVNNILGRIGILALASVLFFAGATIALAATDYASTNESFTQGLQKNGNPVDPLRSIESEALGASDGAFVSLGYGGELIVGFDQSMSGNLVLAVQEITTGAYPLETADVYVSTEPDGSWIYIGEATNEEGLGDGLTKFEVNDCYQYVRIIDTTDSSLHNATSDGFDVDSLTAEYDEVCPLEEEPALPMVVKISLHSSAVVLNDVHTTANTGNNTANGSYAGDGGDGGDIENAGGEQEVEGSATGDGGVGGDASLGGAIQTGDATANSTITNTVNSNYIEIDDCACDNTTIAMVRIHTHDFALVSNRFDTEANTGDNYADGSYAGDGGDGGDIANGEEDDNHDGPPVIPKGGDNHNHHPDYDDDADQEVEDSTTGAGGAGGVGDEGGVVLTGQANTRSVITNTINSNLFRIQ